MKKVFFTLIAIVAINSIITAQTRFGIKGGLNLANQSVSADGIAASNLSRNMALGFHLGVVLDAPLSDKLSIQPGLLFSQKGFKIPASGKDPEISATLGYLEIPINFLFHVTEGFTVGAGPYLAYGLKGSYSDGTKEDAFATGSYKKLDYGLNLTAGFEVADGLMLSANYGLGLANVADFTGITAKNNVIGFSVTKLFGSK